MICLGNVCICARKISMMWLHAACRHNFHSNRTIIIIYTFIELNLNFGIWFIRQVYNANESYARDNELFFWYLMKWKYSGVSLYGQSKVKVEINHYDKTSEPVDIFNIHFANYTSFVFLSIELYVCNRLKQTRRLCFGSFNLNAWYSNLYNVHCQQEINTRNPARELKIKKIYNFVHSQLITHLKSETKKTKWNVVLRPFSWLTTWKLQASNRLYSLCHVLWVFASRILSLFLQHSNSPALLTRHSVKTF